MKTKALVLLSGGITNRREKQVVTSSAQGAIAAKSAYEYLRE